MGGAGNDEAAGKYKLIYIYMHTHTHTHSHTHTLGLWEELERMVPLANISYLFDESKGLGSVAPMYPPPPPPGVR